MKPIYQSKSISILARERNPEILSLPPIQDIISGGDLLPGLSLESVRRDSGRSD